jgi:transposase-like protein
MPKKARRFSRETKVAAVKRMLAGENVAALSRELNVLRKDLYKWRAVFLTGGPEALRYPGRPRESVASPQQARNLTAQNVGLKKAQRRIAELEERVREQEHELRFIRELLQQVDGAADRDSTVGIKTPGPRD